MRLMEKRLPRSCLLAQWAAERHSRDRGLGFKAFLCQWLSMSCALGYTSSGSDFDLHMGA